MNNKIELTDAQKSLLAEMKYYNEELGEFYNIGNIRGIGVTTALLEFCILNNYTLVVTNKHVQSKLIEEYGYKNICCPTGLRGELHSNKKYIVDTVIDLDYIRKNCNVIGGVIDLNGYKKYGSNLKNNKNESNLQLIDILNNEVNCLLSKIEKAREGENSGTYKNLIQSLAMIMELRNKELKDDWELMYSEYKTEVSGDNQGNVNYQKQIAVWEQNSNGEIRSHKVWNVQEPTFYDSCGFDKGLNTNSIKINLKIENKEDIEKAIAELQDKLNNIKINMTI